MRTAGVTRGALYHHFADKKDLFRAVFEDSEQRLVAELGGAAEGLEDPGDLLTAGAERFLDHCMDPRPRGSASSTRRRCSAGRSSARSRRAARWG